MSTRRQHSAEEKCQMVMAVLEGRTISEVARENEISPSQLFKWRKEFLEQSAEIFKRKRPDITEKAKDRRIAELEAKLNKKDAVIALIAEENMQLKKISGGQK